MDQEFTNKSIQYMVIGPRLVQLYYIYIYIYTTVFHTVVSLTVDSSTSRLGACNHKSAQWVRLHV